MTTSPGRALKYPHMFRACELVLLNKIDLLPHLRFDLELCTQYLRQANPALRVLHVSAETGQGMSGWYDWLSARVSTTAALQH